MIKKNDIIDITIESVTNEGSGVGRYEGMAVFVPMTVPGEAVRARVVKVQKTYCYGIVEEITNSSPERIEPGCKVYKRCGGCSLRHMSYRCELAQKERWVADAVRRIGGLDIGVLPILPSPCDGRYRNKAQYPFGVDEQGKSYCGFYAMRTHDIVPAGECGLQPSFFSDICAAVCGYIDKTCGSVYNEQTGTGLFRHLYIRHAEATGQVMVCLVINGADIPEPQMLIDRLIGCCPAIASVQLNHNTHRTNVILGDKSTLLYGSAAITDLLCGVEVDISPLSFYQVNREGAQRLYGVAAEMAGFTDGQLLLDLYCGAGTIGLSMVKDKPDVRLIGVEVVAAAVEDARRNALRAGITNAQFFAGDAGETAARLAAEGLTPDVIVVDPPRKGCDSDTLDAIVTMSPQRVVMVSCNPATMARDIKQLCERGYTVEVVQPMDMFPRTNHVETVCLLSKLKSDHHIE